jgi:hypothetical protein
MTELMVSGVLDSCGGSRTEAVTGPVEATTEVSWLGWLSFTRFGGPR